MKLEAVARRAFAMPLTNPAYPPGLVLPKNCVLGLSAIPYISRYQIRPEERLLQDKFDAEFVSYKSKVRRWI